MVGKVGKRTTSPKADIALTKLKDTKFPPTALAAFIPLPVFLDPSCTYSARDLGCAYAKKASEFLAIKYGLTEEVYAFELGMFATNVEIFLMARKDVLERGAYISSESDEKDSGKTNPSFPVFNKTQIAIEKFLDRYGLSPRQTLPDHALHNLGAIASSNDSLGVTL